MRSIHLLLMSFYVILKLLYNLIALNRIPYIQEGLSQQGGHLGRGEVHSHQRIAGKYLLTFSAQTKVSTFMWNKKVQRAITFVSLSGLHM